MKRYWLFAGETYYPSGGMGDFRGCFDSSEEAQAHQMWSADWAHVFDSQDAVIVATRDEGTPWHKPADGRLEFNPLA